MYQSSIKVVRSKAREQEKRMLIKANVFLIHNDRFGMANISHVICNDRQQECEYSHFKNS